MLVKYLINNYQLGAKLRTAPVDKLVLQERIGSKKTEIVFEISEKEKAFCDKLFARNGLVIKNGGQEHGIS